MNSQSTEGYRRSWPAWIVLGGLHVMGGWLRWDYVQSVSLHVDEFTTLWAARQAQAHGAPWMPSGVLYTRGVLHTYLVAAFASLAGTSISAARMLSVIFGLLTIVASFGVGKRNWSTGVGLIAAAGLTLLPEAIVWSGRARFYSLLQLAVLLMLWAAWEWIQSEPKQDSRKSWSWALVFTSLFAVALFSQEQTLLLYPSLIAAMVLWLGWRWLGSLRALTVNAICLMAIGIRYAIEILGQPGYFETIQSTRPYVGLVFDLRGAWDTYGPLFVAPERLPWTVGCFLALALALLSVRQSRRLRSLGQFHQSTLFYGLQLTFVLASVFLLVGTSWRETRYLYFVQPIWLLLGAAGWVALVGHLTRQPRSRLMATTAAGVILAVLMLPAALRVSDQQIEGYDVALSSVKEALLPGDAVLSPQPPACALTLDHCDGYAIQRGFEEYVIEQDEQKVDRWTGSPLVASAEALEQVIRTHPRTWFVSDSFRLATRYEADYLAMIVDQFDTVLAEQGVLALRADGWRNLPTLDASREFSPALNYGPLSLIKVGRSEAQSGQPMQVRLTWAANQEIDEQINTSIRVLDHLGNVVAQEDGPPARGLIPTNLFFDTPLPDPKTLSLPADLPDGRYRLEVAAYAVAGTTPQGEPTVVDGFRLGPPLAPPAGPPLDAIWQGGLRGLAAQGAPASLAPGSTFEVTLAWLVSESIARDLTAFVHLVGPDGTIVAQDDHEPDGGTFPTHLWSEGEIVTDRFKLAVPDVLYNGDYQLVTGWYDTETGARLTTSNGLDTISLASWAE